KAVSFHALVLCRMRQAPASGEGERVRSLYAHCRFPTTNPKDVGGRSSATLILGARSSPLQSGTRRPYSRSLLPKVLGRRLRKKKNSPEPTNRAAFQPAIQSFQQAIRLLQEEIPLLQRDLFPLLRRDLFPLVRRGCLQLQRADSWALE